MEPMNEELLKSLDAQIDQVFAEELAKGASKGESVPGPSPISADAATAGVEKPKSDRKNPDRPKQISDVPDVDEDGKRGGEFAGDVSSKQSEEQPAEAAKAKTSPISGGEVKKSTVEITESDFAEFQRLKKSEEDRTSEQLRKAHLEEQTSLIKSAVADALAPLKAENEALRKSVEATENLVKSMGSKPQAPRAVQSVQQVERFEKSSGAGLTLNQVLDVAEELCKSNVLRPEHVTELESRGFIQDPIARAALEQAVARKG